MQRDTASPLSDRTTSTSQRQQQHFASLVERKKRTISAMLDGLGEEEMQRRAFQQRHARKLRDIEHRYRQRVVEAHAEYTRHVGALHSHFVTLRARIDEEQSAALVRLRYVRHLVHQQHRGEELRKRIDFRGWQDELKNKMYEDMNIASSKYEAEMNRCRNVILKVEAEYEEEAIKHRAQYDMLMRKDADSVETITKQHSRIKELQDDINGLRENIVEFSKDELLRDLEIGQIRSAIHDMLKAMKKETVQRRNVMDEESQGILVKLHDTQRNLEEFLGAITKILDVHSRLKRISCEPICEIAAKKVALQTKKSALQDKYEALKGSLKDYLSGISVDNESEKINPLLIIN